MDTPLTHAPRMRITSGWMAIAVVLLLGSMAAHLAFDAARHRAHWTNNDNALILFIAREMAHGGRLYVDWQDPALPSIFFIALTAVHLARVGLPIVLAYNLLTIGVGAVGLYVLVRALRAMSCDAGTMSLTAAAYLFFLMKPGALTRDFGQREHLFALLIIPEIFVLAGASRFPLRPVWCAGLAFVAMIKPHFVAIAAVLEMSAPPASRPNRSEFAGFAAGAVAPLALLWWHAPESLAGLFTETISLHLSGAYALLRESPALLLKRGPLIILGLAVLALALLARQARASATDRGLAWRGGLAIVAAIAATVHQQRYFPYHFVPVFGLSVVFGGWALARALVRRPPLWAAGLAVVLVVVGAASFHGEVSRNDEPTPVRLAEVLEADAPRMIVASIYAHGLCTPYESAPRCLGPEVQAPRLPHLARRADGEQQVEQWARAIGRRVRAERPEILALSTGSAAAMPGALTPAQLLLERFPVADLGEYVPLTPAHAAYVRQRYWLLLRRRDVAEREPQ